MSKKKYEDFDDEFEYDDDDEVQIDWAGIFRKLYARRKLFIISFIVTVVVTAPFILTIPKYYEVEVKLAPEFSSMSGSSSSMGGLSSLMRSFGIGSSSNSSGDAILPNLYPDLMNSTTFLVSLFDIPVVSKDGKIKTTYYNYLDKYQKQSAIGGAIGGVMKGIMSLLPGDTIEVKEPQKVNAGRLTKTQSRIVGALSKSIVCDVDNKTGVVTIDVKDQDPVICATVADSTCKRLQEFITEYRSKKARQEMLNAEKQYVQAKADYDLAKQRVEGFNDSNWDLVDEDLIVQKQDLTNKMQMAFQTMSAFNNQLLSARSKYQSSIPVYTVLDGASVPLMPKGPKRKLYFLVILFLVLGGEAAWILLKDKAKAGIASMKASQDDVAVAESGDTK